MVSVPTAKLMVRLPKLVVTRVRVSVTVTVSRAGQAVADLLDRHGNRVAHATARVHGSARLTLRPAHRLRSGRYVVRVRVTAAGRTAAVTRSLRIA